MNLQETYKSACEAYIKAFEKKQGYEFTHWITEEDLGIAVFNEYYYLSLDDLRHDIDNDCEKGLLGQWWEESVEHYENHGNDIKFRKINYRSYAMGARFEMVNE